MEYLPYTYLIGWSKLDRWYYGVEYSKSRKIANPGNLWDIYHTSSKTIRAYREEYGEPDIIEVRRVFNEGTDIEKKNAACYHERRVLQRLKIKTNDRWLNESITGNGMDGEIPIWVRMKISKALKGREFTDEWKAKISAKTKGRKYHNKLTEEGKQKMIAAHLGAKRTKEAKVKMSVKAKERSQIPKICPHCGKSGTIPNIMRYHFDNCKWAKNQ